MALNANKVPNTGGGFTKRELLSPGAYPARVIQIIDLGLQEQDDWKGKEKPPQYEIYVTYELTDEFLHDEDGEDMVDKPLWFSERVRLYPLSSELAISTLRYEALDPSGEYEGDWAQLLGQPCTVNIVNKKRQKDGETVNRIGSVNAMRAKEVKNLPELVNEPVLFDGENPDVEVFNSLPQWLQNDMKGGLEFEGSALEQALGGDAPKKKPAAKKPATKAQEEPEAEEEWDVSW